MAIATPIIDMQIMDADRVYALTETQVLRTDDFSEASPTWTVVFDAEDLAYWDAMNGPLTLTRLKASGVMLYVLGYADQGDNSATGYLMRSREGGDTWAVKRIENSAGAYRPFSVTLGLISLPVHTNPPWWEIYRIYHGRVGYDLAGDYNPWGMADWRDQPTNTLEFRYQYDETTINGASPSGNNADEVKAYVNEELSAAQKITVRTWFDDYFGVGGYEDRGQNSMPKDETRTDLLCERAYGGTPGLWKVWTFWNKQELIMPTAFDVGKHYPCVVYVGLEDKILVSRDEGETWEEYISDVGAYDVECHAADNPQDYDITFWSSDGELYRAIDGEKGASLYSEAAPTKVFHRIASDPEAGWPIFVLAYTGAGVCDVVRLTQSAATGLANLVPGGRCIRCWAGETSGTRRLYFLDNEHIWYSTDDGETLEDKTGDYEDYGNPVYIDPIPG
jgi:hypothetical protein